MRPGLKRWAISVWDNAGFISFMGPLIVIGTYFVLTHTFTREAFLISLPVGCTVTAILAANVIRDLERGSS
jgi:1,4-dihydroxy-2-naphthoate octaprenyltransferase